MELPANSPDGMTRVAPRSANERRILAAIRQCGPLSKAEIARSTGLSAQGVSVIVRSLLGEGLLRKQAKVRGHVGQPSTPLALRPDGAWSIGVKIGRRSLDVATVNFLGECVRFESTAYELPKPADVMALASDELERALAGVGATQRETLVGVGVAIPGDMHLWWEAFGVSVDGLDQWRLVDVAAALSPLAGRPVSIYNDVTAACAAEILVGESIQSSSVLYVFVGSFIGGGIVVDGRLHLGAQGNAGALGSMPTGTLDRAGRPEQLIHRASLIFLERELAACGVNARAVLRGAIADPRADAVFEAWLAAAAPGIARAVASAASVIDFETLVIDGGLRDDWKARLVERTIEAMGAINWNGLSPIRTVMGRTGNAARALGAALLPLHAEFSADPDMLMPPPAGLVRGPLVALAS